MKPPFTHTVADDVAACSAALLFNEIPALRRLPDLEMFDRLRECIYRAIFAYSEAVEGFGLPPEPSQN